jgi:hypothetical protein
VKLLTASIGLSLLTTSAFAQSPYAGMQTRPIKALSKQQVADLQRCCRRGHTEKNALSVVIRKAPAPDQKVPNVRDCVHIQFPSCGDSPLPDLDK